MLLGLVHISLHIDMTLPQSDQSLPIVTTTFIIESIR
jgi:hypothetical protein